MITAAIHASLALFSSVFLSTGTGGATTVHVSLWDKGGTTQAVSGEAYEPGIKIDRSKLVMGVKASPDQTKAGIVKFEVTNESRNKIHELVVMKLDEKGDPLPAVRAGKAIDDDEAEEKGEVSNLVPGASGSLTVALQPGKYLLFCNEPGHYASGMWTELTVEK